MRSLVVLLAACTGTPEDTGDPLPSPYVVPETDLEPPALTNAGTTAAIDTLLASAYDYDATVVFAAYDEVMVYADPACPLAEGSPDGGSIWDMDCTSVNGGTFTGFVSEYQGGDVVAARRLRGEATLTAPDGYALVVAGDAEIEVQAGVRWSSSVDGVMRYDGPSAAGTWFEEGLDLNFGFTIDADETGGLGGVELTGNIGGLDGEVSAIAFTDFYVSNTADWPCPGEPSGSIAVRDAQGVWADLVFDVEGSAEEGWSVDDGACDGCGTLWYDGVVLDTVCVDTSPLTTVEPPSW